MEKKFFLAVLLTGFVVICHAQQGTGWDKWNWLIGNWIGEGSGQPGQGSGTFSFSFDLDKNILIRRSHSEYPATGTKPKIIHDDLMIIYPGQIENSDKAVYFDNEGHIIFYSVSFSDKSIILTSDKIPNGPVFRLIYTSLDSETVSTKFEMSQDGIKFTPYIEGKSTRRN